MVQLEVDKPQKRLGKNNGREHLVSAEHALPTRTNLVELEEGEHHAVVDIRRQHLAERVRDKPRDRLAAHVRLEQWCRQGLRNRECAWRSGGSRRRLFTWK